MASTVLCSIVSAEEEIFSGQVEMVVATGTIGELGILPGHTPLLTGVRPGPVRLILEGGVEEIFQRAIGVQHLHSPPLPRRHEGVSERVQQLHAMRRLL